MGETRVKDMTLSDLLTAIVAMHLVTEGVSYEERAWTRAADIVTRTLRHRPRASGDTSDPHAKDIGGEG